MALSMPIEIRNSGLVAQYWRLTHLQVDHAAEVVEFRLSGWPHRAARDAGKAPLPAIAYRLSAAEAGVADLHDLSSAQLYRAARARPALDGIVWFAGAEDC